MDPALKGALTILELRWQSQTPNDRRVLYDRLWALVRAMAREVTPGTLPVQFVTAGLIPTHSEAEL